MRHAINALVIDDETSVPSLRSAVDWDAVGVDPTFAGDLDEAVSLRSTPSFDVLIVGASDMGLDAMTCFAVRFPHVTRILIAPPRAAPGDSEYVVSSPSQFAELVGLLSAEMDRMDGNEARLEQLVERVSHLPTLPRVYIKLHEEVQKADPDMAKVAALVENDPALTVKVLQLVNSPMTGLRHKVTDVKQAATLIGLRRLTSLVLASGVFSPVSSLDERLVQRLWQDSMLVGGLARLIIFQEGHDTQTVDEAHLAGLLHDIGEVVLFQNWRDDYMNIDGAHRDRDELAFFGATHASISGYLCSSWSLGKTVVDAATFHHAPSQGHSGDGVGVTTAVHVARALVDAGMDAEAAVLDLGHLEQLGVAYRVPFWASLVTGARV
jgi:HD-like signal output (HDOD) protein